MEISQKKFDDLIKKIEELKKSGGIDLSMEEDLSIAVMNLISLEEHLFFTSEKTGKEEYLNMLNEVRRTRQSLMEYLIKKNEGETWCISKHLLATTMRLIEVGTKLKNDTRNEDAKDVFNKAYKMYSLFWALRLKLISAENIKEAASREKPWTLQDIVNKLVDCCDE